MEYDLTQGLRDLSRTPRVSPLPAEPVVRRVRRGRAFRSTAVGLAAAAVVIGAAAVVYAAPWDRPPLPPATPTPAPTEPTPAPTPTPDEDRPIVGLTVNGDLILIDPATGETLRIVYQGLTVPSGDLTATGLAVSPDHSVAYVSHVPDFEPDQILVLDTNRVEILAISLVDGSATRIADGVRPSISPDGTTLAFGALPNSYAPGHGLDLLDLETGVTRHISDPNDSFGPPSIAVWSPDGSRIYLGRPAAETSAVFVLPVTATTLDQAAKFGDCTDAGLPLFLSDGTMLMSCVEHVVNDCIHCDPEAWDLLEMDPDTGEVLERRPPLTALWSWNAVPGPAGEIAFLAEPADGWESPDLVAYDLYLRDGEGERRLAENLAAIAW